MPLPLIVWLLGGAGAAAYVHHRKTSRNMASEQKQLPAPPLANIATPSREPEEQQGAFAPVTEGYTPTQDADDMSDAEPSKPSVDEIVEDLWAA